MKNNLADLQPFEICSIRPPTENYSLTFRLTRNCYWNRCKFCPVYKFGATFSRRPIEEVLEDISRARTLNDLLIQKGLTDQNNLAQAYPGLRILVEEIRFQKGETDQKDQSEPPKDLDPKLGWFLSWFKDKPDIKDSLEHLLTWNYYGGDTCFLGDADSLILKPEFINTALESIKAHFPSLKRFTVYGRTRSAAKSRKLQDLIDYKYAGLHRVHFGLESGSDKVLRLIEKGETKAYHIEGGIKTRESGLSVSLYIMPGLGGANLWQEHAEETADVINKIRPDFVRLRTLQIFPQTPLEDASKNGEFVESDEATIVKEIRLLIQKINVHTQFFSDSATNLVSVNGKLPVNKLEMIAKLDSFLGLSKREQLLFSLEARLGSFMGQYGELPADLYGLLSPYVKGQNLDYSAMSDEFIDDTIRKIREKLMP